MKHFLKVYLATMIFFICIGLVVGVGAYALNRDKIVLPSFKQLTELFKKDDKNLTPLEKAINDSDIINILVVGKEHVRTDTIMVVSYDKKKKDVHVLSVPRDTYYKRENFENRQQKKINAIYQTEGIEGLVNAVEDITQLPIDRYVTVDYDAVVAIVDAIGGVEVDVPFDMNYTDPQDDPPLVIKISKGVQNLDGKTALKYLRFRHNSDGTGYREGDIGRIKAQQEFVKVAAKKVLGLKLPVVIKECFKYVDTDFGITEILSLATGLIDFDSSKIETTIIDHYTKTMDGLSYVFPNEDGIKEYVNKLYGVKAEDNNQIIQINDDGTNKENKDESGQ